MSLCETDLITTKARLGERAGRPRGLLNPATWGA
jgi:hypothetical protein